MPIQVPEVPGLTRDQVLTLMNCRGLAQYTGMIEDYLAARSATRSMPRTW